MLAACSFHTQDGGGDEAADAVMPPHDAGAVPLDACSDKDQDGVCDVIDAWPCGAMAPSDPANIVILHSLGSNVAGVDLGGTGSTKVKVSTPGQIWQFQYAWGLQVDCQAPTCRAQIEYGIAGVGRLGCLADRAVIDGRLQGAFVAQAMATMPTDPGLYELRAKIGLNDAGCGDTSSWYGGSEPDNTTTFAIVCVPP
jgi:hypothetical protein